MPFFGGAFHRGHERYIARKYGRVGARTWMIAYGYHKAANRRIRKCESNTATHTHESLQRKEDKNRRGLDTTTLSV